MSAQTLNQKKKKISIDLYSQAYLRYEYANANTK